ncbi:MAG: hypothetical protein HOI47_34135 [Candidatus Scalindua sp.]|nr:hypothetical protein [Candidatus Scalindua sp.]
MKSNKPLQKKRRRRKDKSQHTNTVSSNKILKLEMIAKQTALCKTKTKFSQLCQSLKIPNQIIAPRPFMIHGKRKGMPGFHKQPLIKKYGKIQMVISGRILITLDEDVFLALSRLAHVHKSLVFLTSVNEIIRTMYKKVARDTQEAVKKSLKRLYGAEIGIMERECVDCKVEEKSYNFRIIDEYALETKEEGKTLISLNDFFERIFSDEINTYINTKQRAGFKSDVAKALYMYLQRNRRESKPYFIKLDKLCENINLQTKGFARSQLWQKVGKGLEVLKSNNYLDSYKLDKNNTIRVWYVKQPKAKDNELEKFKSSPKASTDDPNPILTKLFIDSFNFEDNIADKNRLIEGIKSLVEYQGKINIRMSRMNRLLGTPYRLCKTYIEWLEYQDWMDKIKIGHIKTDGKIFKKFVEEMEEECFGYKLVTRNGG